METMPKIVEPADLRKAYLFLSKTYGKDVYRETIRACGFFKDITGQAMLYGYSWVEKEQQILKRMLDMGLASQLLDNSTKKKECEKILKKAKGELEADFDIEDINISLEHLCAALEIEVKIRVNYEEGGEIEEVQMQGSTIEEAIQKMNHIRWFLNHENDYKWNGTKNGLTELRKLFNNSKANKIMIERKYEQVINEFQNNPYEQLIVLNNHKKNFESNSFENYFIRVKGAWVPVGFAKQFPCQECDDGFQEWDFMKQRFLNQIKTLEQGADNKVKGAGSANFIRKVGRRFCLWSTLFLGIFVYFAIRFGFLLNFPYLFEVWKSNGYNPIETFGLILSTTPHGEDYTICSILLLIFSLFAVLLLLNVLGTSRRCRKLKKLTVPLEKQKNVYSEKIPKKIEDFHANIYKYWSGKLSHVTIHSADYKDLANVAGVGGVKIGMTVKRRGKFLRFLVFVACVYFIWATKNGNTYYIASCGMELEEYVLVAPKESEPFELHKKENDSNVVANIVEGIVGNGIGKVIPMLMEVPANSVGDTETIRISGTDQSSCVKSKAAYMAASVIDGNPATSWQEGKDGPGIDECIRLDFDGTYEVQYIALKLGNWKDAASYTNNNRPREIEFQIGSERFSYEFKDVQEEFFLKLTLPVEAVNIQLNLKSVYAGAKYDDTCISEVKVYGSKSDSQAVASNAEVVEKSVQSWDGQISFDEQNSVLMTGDRIDIGSVQSQLSANQATRSVYVLDITRMQEYEIENVNQSLPASALVAVPVLFTVACDVNDGNHTLGDSVPVRVTSGGRGYLSRDFKAGTSTDLKTMITYALKYSDNNAINSLIDYLGTSHINEVCRNAGFSSVDLQTRIGEYEGGKNNYISTQDTALMLNAIYQNNFSEIDRDFLVENFKISSNDTSNNGMYHTGKNCSMFLNFNGVQTDKYNETGIFMKDEEVFIISVMTCNGKLESCTSMVKNVTEKIVSYL